MDQASSAVGKEDPSPLPQPAVLTPGETREVAGGLNPQPLPQRRTGFRPNRSDQESR
jgi:hypothetical protein